MSKLEDYKKLLQDLKNSPLQYNQSASYFSNGFGQFSELLLTDDKSKWTPSNNFIYLPHCRNKQCQLTM